MLLQRGCNEFYEDVVDSGDDGFSCVQTPLKSLWGPLSPLVQGGTICAVKHGATARVELLPLELVTQLNQRCCIRGRMENHRNRFLLAGKSTFRSEERRVGKECRSG